MLEFLVCMAYQMYEFECLFTYMLDTKLPIYSPSLPIFYTKNEVRNMGVDWVLQSIVNMILIGLFFWASCSRLGPLSSAL